MYFGVISKAKRRGYFLPWGFFTPQIRYTIMIVVLNFKLNDSKQSLSA